MPAELPITPSNPNQEFTCALAGVQFLLRLRWNARDASWYLDISDEQGVPIRMGIRCVLGTFLGQRCVDPRMPTGLLRAIDTSGRGQDAGIDDFGQGQRVTVMFYSNTELATVWR